MRTNTNHSADQQIRKSRRLLFVLIAFALLCYPEFWSVVPTGVSIALLVTAFGLIFITTAMQQTPRTDRFRMHDRKRQTGSLLLSGWTVLAIWALLSNIGAFGVPTTETILLVFYAIVAQLFSRQRDWVAPFFSVLTALAIIHSVATLFFYLEPGLYSQYIKPNLFADVNGATDYRSALTPHYSYNATFIAYGIPMLFGAILNIHNGRKRQSFRLGLLGLLLLALLLTSKRAHLGIIVITLLAMFALTTHSGKLFKGALIAALSSVALLVAQSTIPGVQDALSRFTLSLTEANDINELTTGRVVLWQEAIAGGNSKPLTGKGWGTFNHVWGNGDSAAHAHNALLQVFYALGYPGLIYFVILVVATLTITIQRTVRINRSTNTPPPRKATANAAFGVVFFLVVYACTTGTLLDEAFTYAPFLISISATLVPYPQSVKD